MWQKPGEEKISWGWGVVVNSAKGFRGVRETNVGTGQDNSKKSNNVMEVEARLQWIEKWVSWKQPKCPLTDEWIKKMWYIYTMEYYSAINKSEIMPFAATWMDLEIIILSEVS